MAPATTGRLALAGGLALSGGLALLGGLALAGGSALGGGLTLAAAPALGGGLTLAAAPALGGGLTLAGGPALTGGPARGGGLALAGGPALAAAPALAGGPTLFGDPRLLGGSAVAGGFAQAAGSGAAQAAGSGVAQAAGSGVAQAAGSGVAQASGSGVAQAAGSGVAQAPAVGLALAPGFALALDGSLPFAQEAPVFPGAAPVDLDVHACVAVDVEEIRQQLALELGGVPRRTVAAARVQMTCPAPGAVALVVSGTATGRRVSRSLSLVDVQENARARLLALAAAELLAAVASEPAPPLPSAQTPRAEANLSAQAPASPRPAAPPLWQTDLVGAARLFGGGLSLFGAGLAATRELAPGRALAADLSWQRGERAVALGRIGADAVSVGLALEGRRRLGPLTGLATAGARGGLAWIAGTSDLAAVDAVRFSAPWGGPFVSLGARRALGAVLVSLTAEAGYALVSARGHAVDGQQSSGAREAGAAGLTGPWLGFSLSLGHGT